MNNRSDINNSKRGKYLGERKLRSQAGIGKLNDVRTVSTSQVGQITLKQQARGEFGGIQHRIRPAEQVDMLSP